MVLSVEFTELCVELLLIKWWLWNEQGESGRCWKRDEVDMSRLSFRPRPLDINKKLPIVKSIREFEDDDAPTTGASTRNSHLLRAAAEADNEVKMITPWHFRFELCCLKKARNACLAPLLLL